MSDDDEAELAALRAARMGADAVRRLDALRKRAGAHARDDSVFADGPARAPAAAAPASTNDDGDDDDDDAGGGSGVAVPSMPARGAAADAADAEEAALRAAFPASFGAAAPAPRAPRAVDAAAVAAFAKRPHADALPSAAAALPDAGGAASDASDGSDGEEEAEDAYHLPVSHEAVLAGHTRPVTALDVEHSGSRCVTGGADFGVKIYDFGGMRRDLRPFRELEPDGAHPIRALSWSPTGELFLCVTGSAEPRVIDRDGRTQGFFVRGDMYIRDARHTRGHVMGATSGQWHPRDKAIVLTASEDGTLRTWDVSRVSNDGGAAGGKCQTAVFKPASSRPGRYAVTACCYSHDGGMVAGGISDGSIQVWSSTSNFASAAVGTVQPPKAQMHSQDSWSFATRPIGVAKAAHAPDADGGGVTAVCFVPDGRRLAVRSSDGSLKLWDVRQLGSGPLATAGGLRLPSACAQGGICFSPDGSLLVTTSCSEQPVGAGAHHPPAVLHFFELGSFAAPPPSAASSLPGHASKMGSSSTAMSSSVPSLKLVRSLGLGAAATVAGPILWHPKLNQIFCGAGSRGAGGCRVLFDPEFSAPGGALTAASRAPRTKDPSDFVLPPPVAQPGDAGGKGERGEGGRKRIRAERADRMRLKHQPLGPAGQKGAGGRIGGGTGGTLLTQAYMRESGTLFDPKNEPDIRDAILRHSGANPSFVDQAYTVSQPVKIYAQPEEGEADAEPEEWGVEKGK